ncbi:MAG: hypothetical protein M1837_001127 [Sclerophora amabilis]|nr:MAG: hypothetical protein M1837_001127 [Sclerophora amabilis]
MSTDPADPLVCEDSLHGVGSNGQTGTTGQSFVVDASKGPEFGRDFEAVPKKKKKKSKAKKKKKGVSGFEDNYADAPLTPDEYREENEDLYHPCRSFTERMEFCIQRYRSRRKFDSERKDMFDKYLSLGGIESGPKAFSGGMDQRDLDDKDAGEIARLAATDYIGGDKVTAGADGSDWVVDFEGIVKCFFSSRVPQFYDLDFERIIPFATGVIKNFLNYVVYHNVCPEYNDQVNAARALCDLASKELTEIKKVSQKLPGDFNMACSTLYGGYYQGLYSGAQAWAQDLDLHSGMDDTRAKQVVMTAISAHGTEEQFAQAQHEIKVEKAEEVGFEVKEIVFASAETKEFYENNLGGAVKVLGKLKVKSWDHPFAPEEDVSDDEEEAKPFEIQPYEFWVEEELLQHCFVGMKIMATVRTLNCGVQYFDAVTAVLCSFFTTLEQEMMIGWKRPQELEPRANRIHGNADEGVQPGGEGDNPENDFSD